MIPHIKPLYGKSERRAVSKYLNGENYLTEFQRTQKLEDALAECLGVKYVSLTTSGTAALFLALKASGVGPGMEVIVPDITMIATPNAVQMTGATPILVDIDENGCLDIDKIKVKATTKAIIYVELNGRCGDLVRIKRFCKENNLIFIEDSAQALGSLYEDRPMGTWGRFGCFSLGFHKIITTGQGGFVVSQTREDYEAVEKLKDFGRLKGGSDIHDSIGYNFKFNDVLAVIGLEQLKTLDWRISKKRQIYEWYTGQEPPEGYTPWFIERTADSKLDRDALIAKLSAAKVATRPMYPPIHSQKIYPRGDYPMADTWSNTKLWLPSSLNLTKKEVEYINANI